MKDKAGFVRISRHGSMCSPKWLYLQLSVIDVVLNFQGGFVIKLGHATEALKLEWTSWLGAMKIPHSVSSAGVFHYHK